MATLEDLLQIPPDQITPQHVHMLGLAPDPVVPPAAPTAPPIAKMTPPAAATSEPALPKMTVPRDPGMSGTLKPDTSGIPGGMTFHYHEAPEAKPKEPKEPKAEEKPVEDTSGSFRAGSTAAPVRNWEPIAPKPEAPAKSTATAAPVAPNVGAPSFQPPSGATTAPLPPLTPPPEALRQTSPTATPNALTPPGPPPPIDQSLLNAPKRSLEGFKSREAEPRNLSLDTTAGGPQILDKPGTAASQADIIARARDEAANPYGSPQNHPGFLGKLAHVAARIGNIAGDIVAPGTMALIPGTDLNKRATENVAQNRLAAAQTRETQAANEKSEEGLRQAQIDNLESEAASRGVSTQSLITDKEGDVTGWKDAKGGLHSLQEEGTPQAIKEIAAATKTKQDKEDWSVVPNVTGPNGEPVQQEKTSGQVRIAPLEGAKAKAAKENDFEQYYDDFLKENKFPDTAHNRLLARERFAAAGQAPQRPNQQLMVVPQPDGSSKVIEVRPGTVIPKGGETVSAQNQEKMFQERQAAPTTQMRNVAAQSQIAVDAIPSVLTEINAMKTKLGPVEGRWNEFMQGKVGLDDPQMAGLRSDLLLLSSAVALAHARGRLPENLREEFDAVINAPKQNADNLIATINHIKPWMERQAHIGGAGQQPAAGGDAAGGAKTYSQSDVDAAVKAHPGMTAAQIEDAFKKKNYTKQ